MNKKTGIILTITLVVSFCSICYELLLAQALSAFLENTVLRYSMTMGLYLCAMGIGARLIEGKALSKPNFQMLKIEMALTVIGSLSIMGLYVVDYFFGTTFFFKLFAHVLIVLIGILTGMELPYLMELLKDEQMNFESLVLGFSYIGAVIGTIIFAFVFYPKVGLINTSLFVGLLNGCAGIMIAYCRQASADESSKRFYKVLYFQLTLFVLIGISLVFSNTINQFFVELYLRKGV